MTDINKQIEDVINSSNVVLFMKGTPEMPQCGFSMVAVNILKHFKIDFKSFDVYSDENIRQGIKKNIVIGPLQYHKFTLIKNLWRWK